MDQSFGSNFLRIAPGIFAGLGIVLVAINGALSLANRATQLDVNTRAQFINQSVQLNNLEQALARAAATAAVNNKDARLGDLLTNNGIRYQFTPNANAGGASSGPSAPGPLASSNAAKQATAR